MNVAPIVDALLPQPHERELLERLVAAYEQHTPTTLTPPGVSIWSLRDEVCSRVKVEGRGEAVLRAIHAELPATLKEAGQLARLVALHGDSSGESSSAALTPASTTHLLRLTHHLGLEHLSDIAAWLWFADEAAFARLVPVVRAAPFPRGLDGHSTGEGEVRAFALFAEGFADEAATLRHVARVTGLAAGGGGMCSAAAAWLAARHHLTLPDAPESPGWDGGVFEKAVAVGRLLAAIDQAHPALLAEVGAPLLTSIFESRRIALAARLFGRWDVAFLVSDGTTFLEAASRGGLVYARTGKQGKDGRATVKAMDPKKAPGEVEKKIAAREKEGGARRTAW